MNELFKQAKPRIIIMKQKGSKCKTGKGGGKKVTDEANPDLPEIKHNRAERCLKMYNVFKAQKKRGMNNNNK